MLRSIEILKMTGLNNRIMPVTKAMGACLHKAMVLNLLPTQSPFRPAGMIAPIQDFVSRHSSDLYQCFLTPFLGSSIKWDVIILSLPTHEGCVLCNGEGEELNYSPSFPCLNSRP